MDNLKPTLIKVLWAAAIGFALFRIATATNFGLSAVEGLMVLIAAFVAHKTLDLLMPTKAQDDAD